MSDSAKCPRCNGTGQLQRCHGCGTLYRHIHKYSDCGNAQCEGEGSDDVPCPDCDVMTGPAAGDDVKMRQIAERLIGNSWDTYIGEQQADGRDWMSIADTILLDGRAAARAYIAAEAECRRLAAENEKLRGTQAAGDAARKLQAAAECVLAMPALDGDDDVDNCKVGDDQWLAACALARAYLAGREGERP